MQNLMTLLQIDQPSWIVLQLRKVLIFIPTIVLQFVIIVLLLKICFLMYQSLYKSVQWKKTCWLTFSTIFFIFILYKQQEILKKRVALVVKESAFVYAGPEQSFHTIFQLKSGTFVELLETSSNMCRIMVHGHQGWIASDTIEIQ
ncbi:SH3 domain-containing protein [Candidatus Babeliales bacterium]|nr:SH3 domain-containing protein [Candidatus Babeliales bacterium]